MLISITHRASSTRRARPLAFILAVAAGLLIAGAVHSTAVDAAVVQAATHTASQGLAPELRRNLLLPRRPRTMSAFMTMVIHNVHEFWTKELATQGVPEPYVRYWWFSKKRMRSACGRATRGAPFYCRADDTIYISTQFARRVWLGRVHGQGGTTIGDLGVATVIAHEYAHNLQAELGVYDAHPNAAQSKPFELQADCMAGMWANHAYHQGILEPGDVEEAAATSAAGGDYNINARDHHGTPAERKDAWMRGYDTGDLTQCAAYVAGA